MRTFNKALLTGLLLACVAVIPFGVAKATAAENGVKIEKTARVSVGFGYGGGYGRGWGYGGYGGWGYARPYYYGSPSYYSYSPYYYGYYPYSYYGW